MLSETVVCEVRTLNATGSSCHLVPPRETRLIARRGGHALNLSFAQNAVESEILPP